MLGVASKIMGGLLVGLILVVGILELVRGAPSSELTQRNLLAKAYLDKNKDEYVKCYNSLNGGKVLVGDVKFGYLSYDTDDATKAKLNEAESAFMANVKAKCDKSVADYETNFDTLKQTTEEIAWVSRSKLDALLDRPPEKADYSSYEPGMVRILYDDPFSNLTFTKAEVEAFYSQRMGY